MFHRHTRHHSSSTTVSDLHPFAPSPTPLPPLPQTPASHSRSRPTAPYQSASASHPHPQHEDIEQGMFSRQSRSLSRSGRSTPLLFPHARQTPQPHSNLDLSSALHSQELLDQAFHPLPASSIYSSSPPISPTSSSLHHSSLETSFDDELIPTSRLEAITDDSLFAPASTLSSRKASKLSHSFHQDEAREGRHRMRRLKAEMDIAIGVSRLYKESKHDRRKGRSASFGGRGEGGGGKGIEEVREVFERVKVGLEEETEGKGARDRLSLSGDRKSSVSGKSENGSEKKKGTFGGLNGKEMLETGLAVDAVVGLAAGGYALWKKHEREKRDRLEGEFTKRPSSAPVISPTMDRNASRPTLPLPIPSIPSTTTPVPIYLSHLTPSQHKTLQHASAALLLKHHHAHLSAVESSQKNGGNGKTYHYDEIGLVVGAVVGGWKELSGLVEEGIRKVDSQRKNYRLFGVDIKELTKHEGVESKHGIDPNAKGFKIPEFMDHLITALKQSDLSVSGILRKSASLQKLEQIIGALDHADGSNETILDLAKLDPITLASLFKRFLAQLPHPVFTHHLFGLFIATSHISHPGLKRRAMHLVICLMPKVNRDVMECIFLFLSYLHTQFHLSVIDGQQMDLTGIATIMAPTLLSPKGRDPHPDELKGMIAAVLNLLEDQHILHEIPYELANLLHIEPPKPESGKGHDVEGFIKHLFGHL